MKQVKCWAKFRDSDGELIAADTRPLSDTPGYHVVEMAGTLPEPGRWVRGEPTEVRDWWRWCLDSRAPQAKSFWDGAQWRPGRAWNGPCANAYAPYYWTGDDKPTEAPPSEPEKTCELRWDGEHWAISSGGRALLFYVTLQSAKDAARDRGYRVTNDPREVVLQPRASLDRSATWCLSEGETVHFTSTEAECRRVAEERGWRILREEAAEKLLTCSFCGRTNKQAEVLLQGEGVMICDECVAVCNRAMVERAAEKEVAEQRPTLGEMLDVWLEPDRPYALHGGKEQQLRILVRRIVEAIGRDKR